MGEDGAQGAARPGSAMITRAPVALASSSSGWFGSASTSTTLPLPDSATSLPSRATVISSRPVITVRSPTKRVFRRSISARHSTAAAAATPMNVALRQTTRASCIASGGAPGQAAPPKRSSIWPVNSASTQLCGAMTGAWPPAQGRNEASARITPTATMLSSAASEIGQAVVPPGPPVQRQRARPEHRQDGQGPGRSGPEGMPATPGPSSQAWSCAEATAAHASAATSSTVPAAGRTHASRAARSGRRAPCRVTAPPCVRAVPGAGTGSVNQCLVDELAQLRADPVGAGRAAAG